MKLDLVHAVSSWGVLSVTDESVPFAVEPGDWINVFPECLSSCVLGHDDRKTVKQRGKHYYTVARCQKCGRVVVRQNPPADTRAIYFDEHPQQRRRVSIKTLIERYLRKHGPSTVQEMSKVMGINKDSIRCAIRDAPAVFSQVGETKLPDKQIAKLWAVK